MVKTKTWVLVIGAVLVMCLGLSLLLLRSGDGASYAKVYSDGQLLYTLDLRVDQTHTVQTGRGTNVITVKDGAVAVTEADCPDGYCMDRGFCSGGAQIVCLPNRLVIQFTGKQEIDAAAG